MNTKNTPTKEQAIELMSYLPERPDYDEWIRIVSAVANTFDINIALEILLSRFKDEKPAEHLYKIKHSLKDVHLGTLIHIATKYGYQAQKGYNNHSDYKKNKINDQYSFEDIESNLTKRFKNSFLEDLVCQCNSLS